MMALPFSFLVLLLILSAFFSSVETAFTALSPGQVSALAEKRGKRGLLVKRLSDNPEVLLTTLLIGNNLVNLGASALTTTLTIRLWGNAYVAAATGVLTLAVLVFCEVTPKQIALAANEHLVIRSVRIVWILSWILKPIILGVAAISGLLTRLIAGKKRSGITLENILHHVKAAEGEGVVESFEEEMIRNVFRINDTPVEAIMTHRTELSVINAEATAQTALQTLLESGHSRIPVMEQGDEHVVGTLSLADAARAAQKSPSSRVRNLVTPPYLVPGTLKAHELFFRFKKEPIHLAVVLDEYGGLDGVVTREDVMEEIFGELYDEREEKTDQPIISQEDGSWVLQGDADFYDVQDVLGLELEHDNRTHTVGGYLLEQLERIPLEGDALSLPEGTYTVMSIKKKRILSVRFTPAKSEDSGNSLD